MVPMSGSCEKGVSLKNRWVWSRGPECHFYARTTENARSAVKRYWLRLTPITAQDEENHSRLMNDSCVSVGWTNRLSLIQINNHRSRVLSAVFPYQIDRTKAETLGSSHPDNSNVDV
jgi:hypothetical protein